MDIHMVLFEVIHDQRDSRDENFEFEEMACYFMQHATHRILTSISSM